MLLRADEKTHKFIRALFKAKNVTLVFQNNGFDVSVAAKWAGVPWKIVYRELEAGRIQDTMVRELLIGVATGDIKHPQWRVSLDALVQRYTGVDKSHLKKGDDIWRLRYNELDGVPISKYPQEAYDYAIGDAVDTMEVYQRQWSHADLFEADQHFQTKSLFALWMIGCRSPYVDEEEVKRFASKHTRIVKKIQKPFIEAKFLRPNPNRHTQYEKGDPKRAGFSENKKMFQKAVEKDYRAQGRAIPRTDPTEKFPQGQIKTSQEALLGCTSRALRKYGEAAQDIKLVNAFVPALEQIGNKRVMPMYRVLVSTGRTSCAQINVQQMPRAPGARECFIPPEGKIIACLDYDSFEMFGLAQVLKWDFGETKLLETLNAQFDPHLMVAATLTGKNYQEVDSLYRTKDTFVGKVRQLCKIVNFGAAGGMGPDTFLSNMDQEVRDTMTELNPDKPLNEVMRDILLDWREVWGMDPYFKSVSKKTRGGQKFDYVHHWSGRRRGDVGYTDGCNLPFQGICADAAKNAGIQLVKESLVPGHYLEEKGIEIAGFFHDEYMGMGPPDTVRKWTGRMRTVMVEYAQAVMPDCNIRVGVEITGERWTKQGISVDEFEVLHRHGCGDEVHAFMAAVKSANREGRPLTVEEFVEKND